MQIIEARRCKSPSWSSRFRSTCRETSGPWGFGGSDRSATHTGAAFSFAGVVKAGKLFARSASGPRFGSACDATTRQREHRRACGCTRALQRCRHIMEERVPTSSSQAGLATVECHLCPWPCGTCRCSGQPSTASSQSTLLYSGALSANRAMLLRGIIVLGVARTSVRLALPYLVTTCSVG